MLDDPKGLSKAKQIFDSMTSYYPENPGGMADAGDRPVQEQPGQGG